MRLRRRICLILLGTVAAMTLCVSAWAYWTNAGLGSAEGVTATLDPPTGAVASAPIDSTTVSVSWNAALLSTGQPASGYYVIRIRNSDRATFPACGTSPSTPTATVSCDDLSVTDGDYHYSVTAVSGSWTAVGIDSNTVTVVNDSSLPSIRVTSISPTPNTNSYNNSSPVAANLSATDVSGIASISYTVDGGATVTVGASNASVPVSGDGIHTITFSATDNNGQRSATGTVLIRIDTGTPVAPSAPTMTAATDSGSSPSDGITKVTTPALTGTAEAESTVTLYDGATAVGSGTASSGTYTIAASSLAGGSHSITARATDIASNTGPASPGTAITIDTTAPPAPSAPFLIAASDSGTSATDRLTNVTTPTLTGTAEPGATVTLYNSTTAVGSATATSGSYSVTSTALNTGAKTLTVKATDVAGNVGAASASTVVTIDVTAPSKPGTPVLAAASDTGRSSADKNTSITTPSISGTVTAGSIVTLYDGATPLASQTTAVATYAFTSPTLADGSHVVTVRAADPAGNASVASTSITVIIDTVSPVALAAPTLSASSDTGKSSTDRITKTIQPVMTGSNESKAIVVLYDAGVQVGTVTATNATYSITATPLNAGTHTLTVTPTDVAGNQGPTSAGTTITIDTTAPVAPSTPLLAAASDSGTSSTDGITKVTTPSFNGTAEAGATVALLDAGTATGTAVTATAGTYTAVTGTLTNGTHTISARTTDVAGNIGPASAATTFTVDTVLPTVTLNQAAAQADPTSGLSIDFTVIFNEVVTGFANADVTLASGTAAATTVNISGSGPTYTATITGMTKTGTVIPSIAAGIASDTAGNLNAVATFTDRTVTYTDTTPPAPPSTPLLSVASDTGSSSSDGITKLNTPTFTGTAEIGSTVRLLDGATQVGSVVATAATYAIATTALTNGTHTITATATDGAGNVSTTSSSTSVTIDTVLPTVTLNQATSQTDPTTALSIDFTVIFNEPVTGFTNADVTLSGTAAATAIAIAGTGPTFTASVTGMTRTGTVIPAIAAGIASDTAGNLNAVATYTDRTVTFNDTTAPPVSIARFTAAGDGSQTATVSGTASHGLGDNLTVTVVLCTVNAYPCVAGNTKATLSAPVNASTGAWTVTSGALGSNPTLYARTTQTDLSANTGTSTVEGPIAVN